MQRNQHRAVGRIAVALGLISALLGAAAHAIPAIETWTTTNGARVLLVSTPTLPMVDVRVVFDAGSARDEATPGLARFTSSLLFDGSGCLIAYAEDTRYGFDQKARLARERAAS